MAISRAQLAKELEPGLNALFGMEYNKYENQHAEIFTTESSDRAFEEEVMLSGFGAAPTKSEGSAINFDDANEAYTARYNHETVALAFSITEEAIEDNLYDRLGSRYTRALARSMAHSKQVKAASVLNNAFAGGATAGGDGVALCATNHPLTNGGTFANTPSVAADLNETSLEDALINIAGFVDERGLKVALRGMKLVIPRQWACCRMATPSTTSSLTQMRSSSKQTRLAASSTLSVLRFPLTWRLTSTRATCASKRVSVTASALATHVQCSVHQGRKSRTSTTVRGGLRIASFFLFEPDVSYLH
jgi:hypothetical protein